MLIRDKELEEMLNITEGVLTLKANEDRISPNEEVILGGVQVMGALRRYEEDADETLEVLFFKTMDDDILNAIEAFGPDISLKEAFDEVYSVTVQIMMEEMGIGNILN